MKADRPLSFRGSVVTFGLVIALVGAGAVGIMILLDPRAQAYWGIQFDYLGRSVRELVDTLPLPGR